MKLLVSGSRDGFDQHVIDVYLMKYLAEHGRSNLVIIEGCARGVDTQAYAWALRNGVQTLHFPAPWQHLGKPAGAWRNRQMLLLGQPDEVLCFHPDVKNSRGTRDMATAARKRGVPVVFVGSQL
jgi:hypothetical protein